MAEDVKTTDEQILDNIGEGTSDDAQGTEGQDQGTQGSTEGTETQSVTQDAISGASSNSSGTQQGKQEATGPQAILDKEGKVLAPGGEQRRHFENWRRVSTQLQGANTEIDKLKSQVDAYANAGNLGTQYGLNAEELTTGAQIMKSWKETPVETIKWLLTQAQAAGHNVEGLGAGTDTGAIKTMMETMLAPIMQEHQQRADTQRDESRALDTYNTFMQTYPDAQLHKETIAQLLAQDSSLSLEAAYFKLRSYYYEKTLDWNKPLAQLQSEAARPQPNGQASTQQQLPTSGGVSPGNVTDSTDVDGPDTTMDEIIKRAMGDAGLTYN